MKKIAIALYVVSILLISGLARAEAATLASLSQAQYQVPTRLTQALADGLTIKAVGELPSPCYGQPSAMLTQDLQNPTQLTLHLSSAVPMEICIARVTDFVTQIDLPFLAKASQVRLEKNVVYLIQVDGLDFSLSANGSDLLN